MTRAKTEKNPPVQCLGPSRPERIPKDSLSRIQTHPVFTGRTPLPNHHPRSTPAVIPPPPHLPAFATLPPRPRSASSSNDPGLPSAEMQITPDAHAYDTRDAYQVLVYVARQAGRRYLCYLTYVLPSCQVAR